MLFYDMDWTICDVLRSRSIKAVCAVTGSRTEDTDLLCKAVTGGEDFTEEFGGTFMIKTVGHLNDLLHDLSRKLYDHCEDRE